MLINEIISESGIKTAEIDRSARQALLETLPQAIKLAIETASIGMPNRYRFDRSQLYHRIHNYFLLNRSQLVNLVCDAASIAFTDVAKRRLFELLPNLDFKHYSGMFTHDIVHTIQVFVEDRDQSSDPYNRTTSGYYSQSENILKIFVNGKNLSDVAFEIISNQIQGETDRQNYDLLLSIMIPVFVHEYAHLEQTIRRSKDTTDFGYITTGVTDRGRRGRRGGYMREPRRSPASALRYRGNVDEIDSFASQAAAELMDQIFRDHPVDEPLSDQWIRKSVESVQRKLKYNYSDSRTFTGYADLLKNTFNGAYADLKLRPGQMEKVWKTFAKKVYQKLEDYKNG